MADPKHQFKFAFRFEARDHERVDAWLHCGDDLVLGPLHLTEAQSMQMGCLMEQAVSAMAKANEETRTRAIPTRVRPSEPSEPRSGVRGAPPHDSLPGRTTRCSIGTDERATRRGRSR